MTWCRDLMLHYVVPAQDIHGRGHILKYVLRELAEGDGANGQQKE